MTYVVVENCIKCKYLDCVEVCPVDCFYEGENMLVIHPDECIDCGVCEPECPAEAIKPDTEPDLAFWLKLNADYAKILAEHNQQEGRAARREGIRRSSPINLPSSSRPSRGRATRPKSAFGFDALLTMRRRCWRPELIFFFDFSTILC